MTRRQRILLTGATGFIGRHVLARLRQTHDEVIAVGRRPLDVPPERGAFLACDLTSLESAAALETVQPDVVVHLAALMPRASPPQESLEENLTVNVLGLANLVRCCRQASYFIYVSSVDVYGPPEYLPMDEKHPTQPATYYGATKLAAEKIVQVHCREAGSRLLILRPSQTYGPGEPPVKLIPQTIARVVAGQAPVLYGNGSDCRDYIHVADVAESIARAVTARPAGTLNLVSGTSRSIAEVVDTVLQVSGLGLAPVRRPREKPCLQLAYSTARLRQALGDWAPRDFADGIREQYEQHLASRQGSG
jgi:UDP-glucose 4-epimerase